MTKFELGKKYVHITDSKYNKTIYTCVYVHDASDLAVLEYPNSNDKLVIYIAPQGNKQHFTEYVEPRKGSVVVSVFKYGQIGVHVTRHFSMEDAVNYHHVNRHVLIARKTVEWIEGEGIE